MNQEKKSASGWSSLHKYIMMHCAPPPKKKRGGEEKMSVVAELLIQQAPCS